MLTATQAWRLYNELLQNFTARLFFRQYKYAEGWGKKEEGGKQDDSFSAFCEREVACTCSLKDNSKPIYPKLCNEGVKAKKKPKTKPQTLPLLRVRELRMKIKHLKKKSKTYIHTNSYSFFFSLVEKTREGLQKIAWCMVNAFISVHAAAISTPNVVLSVTWQSMFLH